MVTSGKTIKSEESRFACSIALRMRATLPSKSPLVVLICPIVTRIYELILALMLSRYEFRCGLPPAWSGSSPPLNVGVEFAIIKRGERRDQCCFKTHRPRQEIARQHTPCALLASDVAYAGDFIDHDSQ